MKYLILRSEYEGSMEYSRPTIISQCEDMEYAKYWLIDEIKYEERRLGEGFVADYENYWITNADQSHFIIWNIECI